MRTTYRLAVLAVPLVTALAVSGAVPSGATTATTATSRAPAVIAVFAGASHASAPAAASSKLNGCPSGDFCVYSLPGFGGGIKEWSGNDPNWTQDVFTPNLYGSVNDNDHSWTNNGTACNGCDHVRVFKNINYGGGVTICLKRGQAVASSSAADKGSSHSWYGSCP